MIVDDDSESETEEKSSLCQPNKTQPSDSNILDLTKFEFDNFQLDDNSHTYTFPGANSKNKNKKFQPQITEPKWEHEKLEFLQPSNIRDENKNGPNDANYNPKTLYVPESYLKGLTPAMRQWWEIKKQNFDCVLFFKVGKFYELYHFDATIGVNELNFTYMKGNFAHTGFPEQAYNKMATQLVEKGYKVARIEQTETPDQMNERVKKTNKPTKFDKVRYDCSLGYAFLLYKTAHFI